MGRKSGWRRVKRLRIYTYAEAADAVDVHIRTVRNWVGNDGLEAMTAQRPFFIRGDALIGFLRNRASSGKTPLRVEQFYCLKCRAAREPAGGMADCDISVSRVSLCALCACCETVMHKRISPGQIPVVERKLEVTIRRV